VVKQGQALPLVAGLFEYANELDYITTTKADSQYFVVCEPILEKEILIDTDTLSPEVPSTPPIATDRSKQSIPTSPPPTRDRSSDPITSAPSDQKKSTPTSTKEDRVISPPPPPRPTKGKDKLGKRFENRGKNKRPPTFQSVLQKEFRNLETEKAKRLKSFQNARRQWELRFDSLNMN